MPLVEDQNMIQAVAPKRSDHVQHLDSARATSAMLAGREMLLSVGLAVQVEEPA